MASPSEAECSSLVEELVTLFGSKPPIKRKGWFLKPTSKTPTQNSKVASFPESVPSITRELPKSDFRWWADPQDQWGKWVERLRPIYRDLWKKVGIFDAINTSTYKFRRDPSLLWGLVRFWCGETNTFLFLWGEATVTLEDVMILGGFSVTGEPVRISEPLDGDLEELVAELIRQLREINIRGSCYHSMWMKHSMEEGSGNELEHVAFLSLWLSRFVFPASPGNVIRSYVFPLAVRLAGGVRIALAPAVLASLYKYLRVLKAHLVSENASNLAVWAPFSILQHWIWERFSALSPQAINFVNSDEPRAARWHNVGGRLNYSLVMTVLKTASVFQWRPYVVSLDNWCKPSFYDGDGEWVTCNVGDEEELILFARCLRPCELVGIDCIEQYLPHRVSMQFGFDLDVPLSVPRSNFGWEIAWCTYAIRTKSVSFYVPSHFCEPSVTLEYSIWWKNFRSLLRKRTEKVKSVPLPSTKNRKEEALIDNKASDRIDKVEEICLSEEGEKMVHFLGSNITMIRNAVFLEPISRTSTYKSSNHPFVPSQYKPISIDPKEVPTILFRGWMNPNQLWKEWVEKLKPIYRDLWQEVGIFDAIKSSVYTFKKDRSSLLGAVRFWSEETNTFIFPWGEATITLEDVMILGGYPVLGEPIRVTRPLDDEVGLLESKMIEERKKFSSTKSKKASHCEWIAHYIRGDGEELEHIAFLSMWLSRFVIPAPPIDFISKHVLPIAILLARGVRIALAPAILATIYRDVSMLRYNLIKNSNAPIFVFAPLQIFQLWLWERFSALRPKTPSFVISDEPRASRWHDVGENSEFSLVMSAIESPNKFQWRPYANPSDNWCRPSFYKNNGEWICGNALKNEGSGVFAYCLRACELVGLDCIEQYLPHRVALQFGLDQGIPAYVPRTCSTWKLAWKTYDINDKDVKFYIPPRLFGSAITHQYSIWWEMLEVFSEKSIKRKQKTGYLPCKKQKKDYYSEGQINLLNKENNHTGVRKSDISVAVDHFLKDSEWKETNSKDRVEFGEGISFINALDIDEGSVGVSVEFKYDPLMELEDVEIAEEKSEIDQRRQTDVKDKELTEDVEIRKLKEEISSIQAKITYLESMAGVRT